MKTFHVKNFDHFQHYKDRAPPWIKLYNELLDNYEFGCLQDACKMHLVAIWLLASRSDNKIPYDAVWIGKRINATEKVDLDALVKAGFIVLDQTQQQDASAPLADCLSREETEGETETDRGLTPSCGSEEKFSRETLEQAKSLWNKAGLEHGFPSIAFLNDTRRKSLKLRLGEVGGLDGWQAMLEIIGKSPHLLGDNDRGWKVTFDWILKPSNLTKVMESNYVRVKAIRPNSIAAGFDEIDEAIRSRSTASVEDSEEDPFGLPRLRQSAA